MKEKRKPIYRYIKKQIIAETSYNENKKLKNTSLAWKPPLKEKQSRRRDKYPFPHHYLTPFPHITTTPTHSKPPITTQRLIIEHN